MHQTTHTLQRACEIERGMETTLTLEKRTVTTIPPFQDSQAHPSQVLIFRTLLRTTIEQLKSVQFQNVNLTWFSVAVISSCNAASARVKFSGSRDEDK